MKYFRLSRPMAFPFILRDAATSLFDSLNKMYQVPTVVPVPSDLGRIEAPFDRMDRQTTATTLMERLNLPLEAYDF